MSQTPSTMLPLGTEAPPFSLPDVRTGKLVSLEEVADAKAFLVMFLSRHCPYVQHVQSEIAQLAKDYQDKEIAIIGIAANDASLYPDDAPASLKEQADEQDFIFPYLHDETQEVAKSYQAACTPDFFLFDADKKLVYRGQLDGSRPGNDVPLTGTDLRAAIDAVLAGQPISSVQHPSSGCNIKWKPGNEPAYYG